MTKRCSHCKTMKPIEEFGKNVARKDGLQHYCKECAIAHGTTPKNSAAYHKRHAIGRGLADNYEITADVIAQHMGEPCRYCGEPRSSSELFDRIDNKKGYLLSNIVPCCKKCNSRKFTKSYAQFVGELQCC